MLRRLFILLVIAVGWVAAGCGSSTKLWVKALPPPAPTGYTITLEFLSDLPEPYYVTSGPGQSYARFSLSEQLHTLLKDQVAQLSDPSGARRATLQVRATTLDTTYRQLGARPRDQSPWQDLYASADDTVPPFPLLARGNGNVDIPKAIHKAATLSVAVTLSGDDLAPVSKNLIARFEHVVERRDFNSRTAYDYGPVLAETLRRAAEEITALVQESLE